MLIALVLLCALNLLLLAQVLRILRRLPLPPRPGSESVVGFGPEVVPAKGRGTFEVVLKKKFRGRRLVVPDSIGRSFAIEGLDVDGKPQLQGGPIPAAAFSEMAMGMNLGLPFCKRGGTIILRILNVTEGPATFSAALIGEASGGPAAVTGRGMTSSTAVDAAGAAGAAGAA